MIASTPAGGQPAEDDTTLLIAALNQAWAFYDAETNRGLQIVNYYLVATAILATAYVSAINGKNHAIAAVLAVAGFALTMATLAIGLTQRWAARSANVMVQELFERVARKLNMQSVGAARPDIGSRLRPAVVPAILFILGLALDIGALAYAFTR